MRRKSLSLPFRNDYRDIHEKAGRYKPSGRSRSGLAAWMPNAQRTRYLKTGGIIVFIICLIYYLSPSTSRLRLGGGFRGGQSPSDSSYGTAECTVSSDPSKPILQYVLMIDAGSTGSRIHVYRFNNCGPTPKLEHEEFKMTEKKEGGSGLSSYGDDAEGAAKSLDVLMEVAMNTVPEALRGCSPVAVKATAGLRILGEVKSNRILEAVRDRLETVYPFPVVGLDHGGVEIMPGEMEGVYAWITTNYLLGKIGGPDQSPTAAVFDLGGGSTQIVFEPTFPSISGGMPEKLADGDHKYKLDFGGRKFELYQHSHLGYGLMEARKSIHRSLVETLYATNPADTAWTQNSIVNPCIAPGMFRDVEVTLSKGHPLGEKIEVTMAGPSVPSASKCRALAEKILKKDAKCDLSPCSFNGVHQPSLATTFSREDVYIFSYFFERTEPLGMPNTFTLKDMEDNTIKVCGGEEHWDSFQSVPKAIEELKDRPEWCLDLSFMMALLHTGYEMPLDREVNIAKKINGNELGWCLGASLPLLSQNSGWQCRIKEVS